MKTVVLAALLAFVLAGSTACTSNSSGPYGSPGLYETPSGGSESSSGLSGSSASLHPISGTNEGVEMFKDDDSD